MDKDTTFWLAINSVVMAGLGAAAGKWIGKIGKLILNKSLFEPLAQKAGQSLMTEGYGNEDVQAALDRIDGDGRMRAVFEWVGEAIAPPDKTLTEADLQALEERVLRSFSLKVAQEKAIAAQVQETQED